MNNLFKQFFDKYTWIGIIGLLVVHIGAYLTQHTVWSMVPFVIIVLSIGLVAQRSLLWGLCLAMLEIIVGGHGHLIDISIDGLTDGLTIGIRLGIFGVIMLATAFHILIKKTRPVFVTERDAPILLIGLAVIIGLIIGISRNGFGAAFNDANAYFTLLYLVPLAMIVWTNDAKRQLLWTLGLGAIWVAGSSLFLLYFFTHANVDQIWIMYTFVRDGRIAEVTLLSNPGWLVGLFPNGPWYFRVFSPGQFYVIILSLLLFAGWAEWSWKKSSMMLFSVLSLFFAIDLAGASRSFWLGLIVGGSVIGLTILYDRVTIKKIVSVKAFGILALITSFLVLWLAVVLPVPARPDLTNNPSYQGSQDKTRDLAVSSRWNLLPVINAAVMQNPIVGSGFGTSITYISDDPRIRSNIPNGEYTTNRFEWGWQDIWLKSGLLGLVAFGWLLFAILRSCLRSIAEKQPNRWLAIGFTAGLIALYIIHIFSPYLNHPIGLAFVLIALPFFNWKTTKLPSLASIKEKLPSPTIKSIHQPITVGRE